MCRQYGIATSGPIGSWSSDPQTATARSSYYIGSTQCVNGVAFFTVIVIEQAKNTTGRRRQPAITLSPYLAVVVHDEQ